MDPTLFILYFIVLVSLLVASYTDLKTREVPDWLNYCVIAAGIGLRLLFSVYYWDYHFIIEGLVGLCLFVAVGLIMFYAGQWGGGDSKMLMALGAVLGVSFRLDTFIVSFFINLLVSGAIYGLLFSLYLAIKNKKAFRREAQAFVKKYSKYVHGSVLGLLVLTLVSYFTIHDLFLKFLTMAMLVFLLVLVMLWIFVKVVEKACMLQLVNPRVLTEGDWVSKEVRYKGKVLAGPKDLGVSKQQIKHLVKLYSQKKIRKVWLKIGIPFIPSFLIAFVITLMFGNVMSLVALYII